MLELRDVAGVVRPGGGGPGYRPRGRRRRRSSRSSGRTVPGRRRRCARSPGSSPTAARSTSTAPTCASSACRPRRGGGSIHVPEGRHVWPTLTVHENLLVGTTARRGRAEGYSIDEVYDLFQPLGGLRRRDGWALSGGEQQMVAIGRALVAGPRAPAARRAVARARADRRQVAVRARSPRSGRARRSCSSSRTPSWR